MQDFQTQVSDANCYTTISLDKYQLKPFEFGLPNIYQQLSYSANHVILDLIAVTNGRIAHKAREKVARSRALQPAWDYQKMSCQEECEKQKKKQQIT